MTFKKVQYTISNSHSKPVVKNYFSSTAAQHSRTFQVLSNIFQALYEPVRQTSRKQ